MQRTTIRGIIATVLLFVAIALAARYPERGLSIVSHAQAMQDRAGKSERTIGIFETYKNQVVVLVYHNVDPLFSSPYTITPRMFEKHLQMFQNHGYHVISLTQFLDFLQGGPIPDKAVMLTFDDGYEGVYRYAYPLLLRYHMPATLFIVVHWIGVHQGYDYMTLEQLRIMQGSGLINIGSHSYNGHFLIPTKEGMRPVLTTPGIGEREADYEKRVLDDFVRSRRFFASALGEDNAVFCEPFGASSPTMLALGKRAGYSYFFSGTAGSVTRETPWDDLPRLDAGLPEMTPEWLNKRILKTVHHGFVPRLPLAATRADRP